MVEKKINVGLAKVGMQKDAHPSQLTEEQYTHAKNANTENESGNAINITNEKSNILASKFKEGFVVINQTNDIDTNNTYFFLLNPETGVGEYNGKSLVLDVAKSSGQVWLRKVPFSRFPVTLHVILSFDSFKVPVRAT